MYVNYAEIERYFDSIGIQWVQPSEKKHIYFDTKKKILFEEQ